MQSGGAVCTVALGLAGRVGDNVCRTAFLGNASESIGREWLFYPQQLRRRVFAIATRTIAQGLPTDNPGSIADQRR